MILARIWLTEVNKTDILSLYASLRMSQIKRIYDKCNAYLDLLVQDGGVHAKYEESPQERMLKRT